jgi:RimJ/RimL family protein N-acetyltransferase
MKPVCLHSKAEIERFLRRNIWLHLYELGDLDDFFWRYTTWYALKEAQQIRQLVLLYLGFTPPTLLALAEAPFDGMRDLLRSLLPFLPKQIYAHLSGDLAAVLEDMYRVQSHGTYYKMALTDKTAPARIDSSAVTLLSVSDRAEIEAFYEFSYPGNWFDSRMLETGCYYGLQQGGRLASVAGVHVYSQGYRVATLGNIATHPDFRGRGLATATCARLCQALLAQVDHVGLNVRSDNHSAIACYERLGFERIATYGEYSLQLK